MIKCKWSVPGNKHGVILHTASILFDLQTLSALSY